MSDEIIDNIIEYEASNLTEYLEVVKKITNNYILYEYIEKISKDEKNEENEEKFKKSSIYKQLLLKLYMSDKLISKRRKINFYDIDLNKEKLNEFIKQSKELITITEISDYLKIRGEIQKFDFEYALYSSDNGKKYIVENINKIKKYLENRKKMYIIDWDCFFYNIKKNDANKLIDYLRLQKIIETYNIEILEDLKKIESDEKRSKNIEKQLIEKSKITKFDYYYRGVYDINYRFLPSAMRDKNSNGDTRFGKESKYYHYIKAHCPEQFQSKSHLDTLVRMQHYDCPTRLLDITRNPLVALYFACKNYGCEKCSKSDYGCVYIFCNPEKDLLFSDSDKAIVISCLARFDLEEQQGIYKRCIEKIKTDGVNGNFSESKSDYISKLYHEIETEISFEKKLKAADVIENYYVQPNLSNSRIKLQSGLFILPGLKSSQDEYEASLKKEIRVQIKISNQDSILKELDALNINEASLFPEIDKVAKYYVDKL